MEELIRILENSTQKMQSVDETDLQGLAELHTSFNTLGTIIGAFGDKPHNMLDLVESASEAAAALVEKIILHEIDDARQSLQTINETAKILLQTVIDIHEGREITPPVLPKGLGLTDADTPATDAAATAGTDADADPEPQEDEEEITLPDNVDAFIFNEFLNILPDKLGKLEEAILTAEKDPTEQNLTAIKIALHNLKGESALMGLNDFADLSHEGESIIEKTIDGCPAEQLFEIKDWMQNRYEKLCQLWQKRQKQLNKTHPENEKTCSEKTASLDTTQNDEKHIFEISDIPLVQDFIYESYEHLEVAEANLLTLESNPRDNEAINSVFRAFHTIKGVAGFLNLKKIGSLAHSTENLLDMARKNELLLSSISIDIILEANDAMKKMLSNLKTALEEHTAPEEYPGLCNLIDRIECCGRGETIPQKVGQTLIESGEVSISEVREAVVQQQECQKDTKKIGEILIEKNIIQPEQLQEALNRQTQKNQTAPAASSGSVQNESSVKVATSRLDALINMVGELVIAESMVGRDLQEHLAGNQRLTRNARHLDKITRELQELSMSMRMVPVQGVFQKMARLVRDLSRKAGKSVNFTIKGAETELDRNVVEAISDPLVHMIRNSVDHGIETPEERIRAGKNAEGNVELRAFHQGGNIIIEIADDGRGLHRDKIVKKAIKSGMIKENQELSDTDVYRLIFQAGLSTAEKVTDISGRGVGMDVVRKNIEALRGRIDINSKPGHGTTFSIHLPLTLAVIDGQMVTVGRETFIVPTNSIEQSLRPERHQISTVQGGRGEMIEVRNRLIPLVRLHELFNIEPRYTDPCESLTVIVCDGNKRCALQVDSLLSQHQVVIKNLGEYLGSVQGVSGAAIMGDGNVSLIMDIPGLIQMVSDSHCTAGV